MNEPILKFSNTFKSYGSENWVIRDLSTEVHRSERVLVTGKRNTGKSTLLKLAATLLAPTVGTIEIFGEELNSFSSLALIRRNHFGLILPEFPLIPHLSLAENIAIPLVPTKIGKAERVALVSGMLDQIPLDEPQKLACDASPLECFIGMLGRSLINNPDFLIIDELRQFVSETETPVCVKHLIRLVKERDTTLLLAHEPSDIPEEFDRAIKL